MKLVKVLPQLVDQWSLDFLLEIPLGSCKWQIVKILWIIFMLSPPKKDVKNLNRVMFLFGVIACHTNSKKLNPF